MNSSAQVEKLKSQLESLKQEYYSKKGKHDQLLKQKSALEEEILRLHHGIDTLEQVRVILQQATEFAREQSRQKVETLVTNCLQFIFDTNMEFRIDIHEARSRHEAEFYVVTKTGEDKIKTKPQEARGGGIVDIISLALRIAMLQSSELDIKGPIILDEPAKHVSEEYIVQVGEFLRQMSRMFDRQIIMVTHNRHLSEISDKSYRIEMTNGISSAILDNNAL